MKMIKYIIATMLIVTISRKMYMKNNQEVHPMDMQELFYNQITHQAVDFRTAERFIAVREVNPTVTPPTTTESAIQAIRLITISNDPITSKMLGASNQRRLYGFPVTGKGRSVIKNGSFVGLFWPHENLVSLEDGSVFVGIKKTKLTQKTDNIVFNETETKSIQKKYNMNPNDIVNVIVKIGTLNNGDILYGIRYTYPAPISSDTSMMEPSDIILTESNEEELEAPMTLSMSR